MSTIHMLKIGEVPVEQGLLDQALSFFNGGSRCIADIGITPTVTNCPMSPAIVCFAFSAELYLKLLIAISSGTPPRGHKLDELFELLPPETRTALADIYGGSELPSHLKTVSSAFIDWRYQHEHRTLTISPQILINIATSCHKLARRLRPELRVFGENDGVDVADLA